MAYGLMGRLAFLAGPIEAIKWLPAPKPALRVDAEERHIGTT
jgi:hypothetical protein